MTYKITFLKQAKKEWDDLSHEIQSHFKKKLLKIIESPHISKCKMRGMKDCYKVKLSTTGYRLVYRVIEEKVVIQVITVGRRDKNYVYKIAIKRIE